MQDSATISDVTQGFGQGTVVSNLNDEKRAISDSMDEWDAADRLLIRLIWAGLVTFAVMAGLIFFDWLSI